MLVRHGWSSAGSSVDSASTKPPPPSTSRRPPSVVTGPSLAPGSTESSPPPDDMDQARWQRLQALFAEAREAPPEERAHLLAELTRNDSELAAELVSLLDADAIPGPMDALADRLVAVSNVLVSAERDALVPERVGQYRVIRELGRGGMGAVYLAERADGHFEQQVAIKLIDETRDDDPHHRRFLAERQILAGLVHPNIARLLDGGITEDGRPYLVMEYVDGLPITEWCDQHRLDLRARITL